MDTQPTHDQIRNRVQALEQKCSVLKQERDALQESQELYRMVVENSKDGVAISEQACFQYANPALLEMFGYDHLQEVIDQPIDMLVHPDDLDRVSDIFLRGQLENQTPAKQEFTGLHKSGRLLSIEVTIGNSTLGNRPGMVLFCRDISERKHAEEILKDSEAKLRLFIENTPAAVAVCDTDMCYLAYSRRWITDYHLPR